MAAKKSTKTGKRPAKNRSWSDKEIKAIVRFYKKNPGITKEDLWEGGALIELVESYKRSIVMRMRNISQILKEEDPSRVNPNISPAAKYAPADKKIVKEVFGL